MNVFDACLDGWETGWENRHAGAGERLTKFDLWLYRQLKGRIDWSWSGDETAQGRRINQARKYVERMVLALWKRGWLLDGAVLAKHVIAPLNVIGEYQKKGTIKEFWPYFCATIDRYVGVNSEEIQIEAKRIGATMAVLLSDLAQITPSLTELLALRANEAANERTGLREKQRLWRAGMAQSEADSEQMKLFG